MEQLTLTKLREICRTYNIHTKISKYSKLKKDELITEMKKHLVYGNNEILPINSMVKIPTKVIEKIIEEEDKPVIKNLDTLSYEELDALRHYIKIKEEQLTEKYDKIMDILKEKYKL